MERLAQKLPQGGYKAKVAPFSVLERLGRLEDPYDALIPRGKRRPLRWRAARSGKGENRYLSAAYCAQTDAQNLIDRMDIYEAKRPAAKK